MIKVYRRNDAVLSRIVHLFERRHIRPLQALPALIGAFCLLFAVNTAHAQTAAARQPVSGTVVDEQGQALIGVTVVAKNTTNGTATDVEGRFTINAAPTDVLQFSYIGYETKEVPLGNQSVINVTMAPDAESLEEVVVVGYGTQKKANLTGAVTTVNMDEVLGDRPVTSTAQALQGAAPALEITSGSGRPGEASGLNIRGINSLNGGSPLVLVDNVPMSIDDVNPKDIESVTVLKDAAASSIYGGRAAFGVILITTKKGQKNQPIRFNYSNNFTFSQPTDLPEKVSTLQFVRTLQDLGTTEYWTGENLATWEERLLDYQQNPGNYPEGQTIVDGTIYRLAENSLYDQFIRNGFEQLHNFSFSGGSEKSSFRVSLGYADEDGIMATNKDAYRKYNLNTSLSTALTKNLEASVNIFYKNDSRSTPNEWADMFYTVIGSGDYTPTGSYTLPDGTQLPFQTPNNLLEAEDPRKDFGDDLRLFGKLDYNPLAGLKITGEYTFNKTATNRRQYYSDNAYVHPLNYGIYKSNENTSYLRAHGNTDYYAVNVYANYDKSFNNHNFKLLAGTNQEKYSNEYFSSQIDDIISPDVPALSTGTGEDVVGDSFGEYAISGYFGRFNYNYKNKYLFEANGRYDGSSRFASDDHFGFFPSFSAGWVVTEEPFMRPLDNILTTLKFRGSWGEIGNQVILIPGTNTQDYYPYVPGMDPYLGPWINPVTNIRNVTLTDPNLVSAGFTWETVRTLNFGVDASFFQNRLSTTFDWFRRQTLDMLAPGAELPAVLGTPAPLQNVADLESKGWELEVAWRDNIKEFNYSFGFNLSDNRGYITKFDNPAGLISQYYVGQELGEIWGYETQGYFTADDFVEGTLKDDLTGGTLKEGTAAFEGYETKQNPGDTRYADLNGDGVINDGSNTLADPGDRKIIGNSHRRYQFGAFGNASYKNFDLSVFLQGVGKRDVWLSNELFWLYNTQFEYVYEHQLDYWTPENTGGFYPRSYKDASGNTGNSRRVQTKYLTNGAYLRVRNITLGYTLPKALTEKARLAQVRLFASGENLFTFDHLPSGLSAEVVNVSRGAGYPFLKKYSVGLNVSF